MTQSNMINLLSAPAPQSNLPLDGQGKATPISDPAQFINWLAEMLPGRQAPEVISIGKGLVDLGDILTAEEMDLVAGLLADSESAEAAPAIILFNQDGKIQGDRLMPETITGNGQAMGTLNGNSGVPAGPAAESLPGGEAGLSADIFLPLNSRVGNASDGDANPEISGDKGQHKAALDLVSAADLESLAGGERLTVLRPSEAGRTEEISFLKGDRSCDCNGKSFTKLEIEVISENKSSRLSALLVTPKESTPKTVGDLAAVIPDESGSEARLALVCPKGIEEDSAAPVQSKIMSMAEPGKPALSPAGEDAALQLRRLELREQSGGRAVETAAEKDLLTADSQVIKELAAGDGKSDSKRALSDSRANAEKPLNASAKAVGATEAERFAAKLGESRALVGAEQVSAKAGESAPADESGSLKDNYQARAVEFKLQPPAGGTKIPENGYFRIKLEPESLGKIEVHLQIEQDRMIANLKVDSALTRQVVEANLPQLKEALNAQGIKVDSLVVDFNGSGLNQHLDGQQAASRQQQNTRFGGPRENSSSNEVSPTGILREGGILNLKGRISLLA